jgi:RimJ/RimL family protein N-acetyltransferase
MLWEWANDTAVRAVSFCPEPIPWDEHQNWFRTKLGDQNAIFYLVVGKDELPVGSVRYQIEGQRAVVSINVPAPFRGKGYSRRMLALANERLFHDTSVVTADAYVKPDNVASLRLFRSAGFKRVGRKTVKGQEAVHFALEKNGWS